MPSTTKYLALATVALWPLAESGLAQQDPAGRAAAAVSEAAIESHLRFLSDDALEGRGAGTRGERLAALYIAAQFRRLRLEPAGDSGTYFHHFVFNGRPSRNVIGCIPGPPGASQSVLLGAHYDAVGIGPDMVARLRDELVE